jgi:hypothetical protein
MRLIPVLKRTLLCSEKSLEVEARDAWQSASVGESPRANNKGEAASDEEERLSKERSP